MSILGKKWIVLDQKPGKSLLESLLLSRGIQDQKTFLEPNFERDLHDPALLKDMDRAVTRIKSALEKKEKIVVVGDYDMDGISATALLVDFLSNKLGANVTYRLPNRLTEGYGLNQEMVNEAIKGNIQLVITVDNGISCVTEIASLKAAGIDTIITDHHAIPASLPPGFAIIHPLVSPNYPFKELSGVGVAYKLVQALAHDLLSKEAAESHLKWALDLVALGTVADCMTLQGENRVLTKFGLQVLAKTKRKGLQALLELSNQNGYAMNVETISFRIAPRLNAAGRLKDASLAVELLLCEDEKKALEIASALEKLNSERQVLTEKLCSVAEQQLGDLAHCKIIIAKHPEFHAGVVGLVAGRLAEKYALPTIILEEGNELFTASCRSPEGFNMINAITSQALLLDRFGGHAQAAGFTVLPENFADLKQKLEALADSLLADKDLTSALQIDAELNPADLSLDIARELEDLAPFGIGNPKPLFLLKNLELLRVKSVGDGKHLKLNLRQDSKSLDGIGFRLGDHALSLGSGMRVDVVGHLEQNHWNGNTSLQLQILDLAVRD
ncbi:MAG: single-stranded-DNA-specific exonuclease RecJ [Candidatus Gracilibacteria bacterium]|nr:single-stranded-DNA-specific exonuclease RecJ [Candidatus Gracilibacteria bacterium]